MFPVPSYAPGPQIFLVVVATYIDIFKLFLPKYIIKQKNFKMHKIASLFIFFPVCMPPYPFNKLRLSQLNA